MKWTIFDTSCTRVQFCRIREVLQGLKHIHENNLIHRNVCPRKIFFSHFQSGRCKLSYPFPEELTGLPYPTTAIIVPLYGAPEVIQSNAYSTKCDIWKANQIAKRIFLKLTFVQTGKL